MPRINRIRLVNFSWGKQRIDDLMLDFHGGQNAELRLENGGGKSVLERLIYQAIWPGATISSNPISDYLNTKPATVAVEWLLDTQGEPDYLLSGTVLMKQGASEEDNTSVNYFCFLSHDGEQLEIHDLPNVHSDGRRITIAPFADARQSFRNACGRSLEAWTYGKGDASEYRKRLKSFHISAENWDTLIRQLISGEDPFKDVLEKTRTGDTLLDRYLIPKIEAHLDEKEGGPSSTLKNLDSLVQKSAEQKKMLKLRDLVSGYLSEEPVLLDHMHACRDATSERDHALLSLSAFADAVRNLNEESRMHLEEVSQKLQEAEQRETHIHQEQASAAWYAADEALRRAKADSDSLEQEKQALDQEIESCRHAEAIAQGTEYLRKLDQLDGTIRGLQQKQQEFSADERQAHLQALQYSLKLAYEAELQHNQERLDACLEQQAQIADLRVQKEKDLARQKKQQKSLTEEQTELKVETGIAEKKEQEIFAELDLGMELNRTLAGGFSKEDITAAERILNQRIAEAKKNDDAIRKRLSELPCELSDLSEKHAAEQTQKEADLLAENEEKKNYQFFLDQKDRLLSFFRINEIAEQTLYSGELIPVLADLLHSREIRQQETDFSLGLLKQLIRSIEKNISCIPESFDSLLRRNGIVFQTGEEFLKEQQESEELLNEHPLLPYGILVESSEWKKLQEIDPGDLFLDRVIPIFRYDDLKQSETGTETGSVLELQDRAFWNSYEKALLNESSRQKYLEKKKENYRLLQQMQEDLNTQVNAGREALKDAENFHYSASYEKEQQAKLEALKQALSRHEETLGALSEQEQKLQEEKNDLSGRLYPAQHARSTAEEHLKLFRTLLENDQKYTSQLNKLDTIAKQLEMLGQKCSELETELRKLENQIRDLKSAQDNLERDLAQKERDAAAYQNAPVSEVISGSLEALKVQYQEEQKVLDREKQSLLEEMEQRQTERKETEQKFNDLSVEDTECRSHPYDPSELTRLRRKTAEKEEERKGLDPEYSKVQRILGKVLNQKEAADQKLASCGLEAALDPEQILGRFEERLLDLKKEKDTDLREQKEWESFGKDSLVVMDRIRDREPILPATEEVLEADREHLSEQCSTLLSAVNEKRSSLERALSIFSDAREEQQKRYCAEDSFFDKVFADSRRLSDNRISLEELNTLEEMLMQKEHTIAQCLDRLNTDLSSYDHDRDSLFREVIRRTEAVLDGIGQVSRRSRVRVEGKSQPTALLRFDLPDTDDHSEERLKDYLEQTVRDLSAVSEDRKQYTDLRDSRMDPRKLINAYLQRDHIPVKIYKFEKISANSRLMDWDRACRSNSGGEHSLSCFIVIASLMAYIQNDNAEFEEDGRNERYETVICDNPFASVSSEHLVRPLVQIVQTLHIQLITFTHITSQSIANSFDVVIQLRNVRSCESQTRMTVESESVSEQVSRMEQASLFRHTEQQSLF